MTNKYVDIIENVLEKEAEILGQDKAVSALEDISGIEISENGSVKSLEGDEKEVLGEVVKKYQKIGGKVSATLIAKEIKEQDIDDLELPDVLAKRIRAEKFSSAI